MLEGSIAKSLDITAFLIGVIHTAAEVIYQRADEDKDNMGLTSWAGKEIKRSDVGIAKNYLNEKEIDALNKIVTAYLVIAEVHALKQEPMYMKDWLETINDYLKMTNTRKSGWMFFLQ